MVAHIMWLLHCRNTHTTSKRLKVGARSEEWTFKRGSRMWRISREELTVSRKTCVLATTSHERRFRSYERGKSFTLFVGYFHMHSQDNVVVAIRSGRWTICIRSRCAMNIVGREGYLGMRRSIVHAMRSDLLCDWSSLDAGKIITSRLLCFTRSAAYHGLRRRKFSGTFEDACVTRRECGVVIFKLVYYIRRLGITLINLRTNIHFLCGVQCGSCKLI